jgi:Ca2+-transporting ATPase
MLSVMGVTFVLQVLLIQYVGVFFGTIPLPLDLWVKLFAIASSVIVFAEIVKLAMKTKSI